MNSYDQVEWLRSNKGGAKIIHKGYMYTIHKKRYGKIRWRCAQRTLHCKGSITTGSGAPFINLPHNHIPDLHAVIQARSRTSQVTDDNESEYPADWFPLFSDNIYSYADDYEQLMDQNSDNEIIRPLMDEVIRPQQNKSLLKSPQKIQPIQTQSSTMTSPKEPVPRESEMCLRWNSHHTNMQTFFPSLLQHEKYVDVTLASDGQLIKCHKLVLSSCSDYFDDILKDTYPMQHTVIYLRDVSFWIIKALVDFMYKGEINIDQMKLEPLLKAAEDLQIRGLARKTKVKKEPDPVPIIPEQKPIKETSEKIIPEPRQPKETIEKTIKKEVDKNYGENDDEDDDYMPSPYYKKKLQPKKMRKRKIATPPDPASLKHVKINLKGTKSRPNIKQPKFYDPDYPEYNPDRSSPPKLDSSDPIFNIGNIKMEPIDFEVPSSPSYSEISSLMDQSLSECAPEEKSKSTEKNKSLEVKSGDEMKKIRKYAGKFGVPVKSNFTQDKHAIFQTACSSIDIPATTTNKDSEQDKQSDIKIDTITSVPSDSGAVNKNTILLNVQNKSVDSTSVKPTFSQIRVRNLTTTDNVLRKFASTHLTSILKKDSMPAILRRVSSPKPAILRHSTPKKIEIVKADSSEIAEKLSALAKTKKELTSAEAHIDTPPESESKNIKSTDNLTDTTTTTG